MTANEIKKRIAKLKRAGIQKGAIAKKMKMSDKVFSTRTSRGNWTIDEQERILAILNEYPIK